MGSGHWAASTYHARASVRAKSVKDTFAYSRDAFESGVLRPHQTLDPQGMGMRESRDNADHPASTAILISLDVTGSMGKVVRGIHANLPQLHELLLGHGYVTDPQICFAAVGDATCDRVPLQVGQFEADNRMDENLENVILEGGGGGQKTESYELMLYVAARHTTIDCWEKRQQKGYLFIIGDELAYPAVSAREVTGLIGPELQSDLPLQTIVAEARQKYHVFYILPGGASYGRDPQVLDFWKSALGDDRVIVLQDPGETSECIAMTIGLTEGRVDSSTAAEQLRSRGVVARTIDNILNALRGLTGNQGSTPSDRDRRL